jgi:hypothetical protein
MILTNTYSLLQANLSPFLVIKKCIRNKKYLINLFGDDLKLLLGKEDAFITSHLVNIFQIICNSYGITPSYELIKYLLLSAAK